jgi:hypothetical protein
LDTLLTVGLVDPADFDSTFSGRDSTQYPLTATLLLIRSNDSDAAKVVLETATPGSEFEEGFRLCLLVLVDLSDLDSSPENDLAILSDWCQSSLPLVEDLFSALPEPWEQIAALSSLVHIRNLARDWFGQAGAKQVDAVDSALEKIAASVANQKVNLLDTLTRADRMVTDFVIAKAKT